VPAPTFVLNYVLNLTAIETITVEGVDPNDNTVTLSGLNESGQLTGSTTPPVSVVACYELTLSSGAATIDLTSLPGLTSGETLTGSGLKAQFIKFINKAANANSMTVSKGASNGYGTNAAGTTFSIPLSPGQSVTLSLANASPTVGGSAKTIDVAGTGAQVLRVFVALG